MKYSIYSRISLVIMKSPSSQQTHWLLWNAPSTSESHWLLWNLGPLNKLTGCYEMFCRCRISLVVMKSQPTQQTHSLLWNVPSTAESHCLSWNLHPLSKLTSCAFSLVTMNCSLVCLLKSFTATECSFKFITILRPAGESLICSLYTNCSWSGRQ